MNIDAAARAYADYLLATGRRELALYEVPARGQGARTTAEAGEETLRHLIKSTPGAVNYAHALDRPARVDALAAEAARHGWRIARLDRETHEVVRVHTVENPEGRRP